MTTEEDFQKKLDENPTDWQTRLVFADWLQERGDERAEGYRALAALRIFPSGTDGCEVKWQYPGFIRANYRPRMCWGLARTEDVRRHAIPDDWFYLIPIDVTEWSNWRVREKRREIEDAAALAFAKLPPDRQVELLGQNDFLPAQSGG
jgi:uncharacterized protein (TIGR02996 family)